MNKILLLTQGSQGVVALRSLFSFGYTPQNVVLKICKGGENSPLISYVEYLGMRYELIKSSSELDLSVMNLDLSDLLVLSVSWKYKVSKEIIQRSNFSINLHPGLLPEYKGCFSTCWSIINNENKVGYTYHYMDGKYDTGDIIYRKEIDLNDNDNAFNLNYLIFNDALFNLNRVIEDVKKGIRIPQKKEGRYYKNELPYGGVIPKNASKHLRERIARATYFPPYKPAIIEGDPKEIPVYPEIKND